MGSCSLATVVCEQQRYVSSSELATPSSHMVSLFTKVQYDYGTFMCKSAPGSLSLHHGSLIWTNVNVLFKEREISRLPLFRDHWASCVDFLVPHLNFLSPQTTPA